MKYSILLLTLFLALNGFSQAPSYVPTDSLVGWWPLSGNANDESGNGNNGTIVGATLIDDRFGNPNSAYNFNPSNGTSELIIPHNSSVQIINNYNYTFSFWVRAEYNVFHNPMRILSKFQYPGSGAGFSLSYFNDSIVTSYGSSMSEFVSGPISNESI